MKKKCKSDHGWAYLNKRFDDNELTIVAFCDECGYIDKEALRLQRAVDKAEKAYSRYKALTVDLIFYRRTSKSKNN